MRNSFCIFVCDTKRQAWVGVDGGKNSWNRVSELYIEYSYSTIVPHTHLVIRSPLSLCNIYIYAHYLTLTMKYCVKTYIHGKYKKKIIKIMKNKKIKLNFYFSLLDFEFGFYFSHVLLVVTSFREFYSLRFRFRIFF